MLITKRTAFLITSLDAILYGGLGFVLGKWVI